MRVLGVPSASLLPDDDGTALIALDVLDLAADVAMMLTDEEG